MELSPIQSVHSLECPHCKAVLLNVGPASSQVPGLTSWLTDGDAIPGVPDALPGQTQQALMPMLSVGRCAACNGHYYVAEVITLSGPLDLVYDWMAGALKEGASSNFVCRLPELQQDWCLFRTSTDAGAVSEYMMGPFPLCGGIEGPNGVSACGSPRSPWEEAREIVASQLDLIAEFQRLAEAIDAGGEQLSPA
ncbi:MAG: hypothetical protein A2580_00920 [Hydrogenophilales bacterium RIFOXYD1_FULL_62_11]|nr:MAG: hypothetical protein A2580_00920 [Hydrogenophilales bacterium RIFOXYD1_FULL_62_11]